MASDRFLPTREYVEKLSIDGTIYCCDDANGLNLFCYEAFDKASSEEKKIRGVVFHNDELISAGLGYTPEFIVDSKEYEDTVPDDLSNVRCTVAYEGFILRAIYFKGWYLASSRRLDARASKWGSSQSFGEIFKEALVAKGLLKSSDDIMNYCEENLSKDLEYSFLIRYNVENRMVCNGAAEVYHIASSDKNGTLCNDSVLSIPKPAKIAVLTKGELTQIIHNSDPLESQGVVLQVGNTFIKVYSKRYHELFKLRKNVASVKLRYVELMNDDENRKLFRELYPEKKAVFDKYDEGLKTICEEVVAAFYRRYTQRKHVYLSEKKFVLLRACAKAYANSSSVTYEEVRSQAKLLSTTEINKMIRDHFKPVNSPSLLV